MSDPPYLTCPECGSTDMTLTEIARVGLEDEFSARCSDCNLLIAAFKLSRLAPDAELPSEVSDE